MYECFGGFRIYTFLEINRLIHEIKEIQTASELPLSEFRRIVSTVQQGESSANRAKKQMIESNLFVRHSL